MAEAAIYPPMPLPNAMTQFFWDGCKERKLRFLRCNACGHFIHYPRPICSKCLSEDLAPKEVSGRGTLYAYTVATQAFHPYFVDKTPYTLAIVALEEQPGLHMTTNIVDTPESELRVGLPVKLAWRAAGPELTLPMFTKA